MKNLFFGIFTFLSLIQPTFSADHSDSEFRLEDFFTNERCQKARLQTLKLTKSDESEIDLCEKKVADLTLREKEIIAEITGLNEKVAKLFGRSLSALLKEPYTLRINETVGGFISSEADDLSIDLGTFPNTKFLINHGVYLHEFGHLLSGRKSVSNYIYELSGSDLFIEMFADLIPLSSEGTVLSPSPEGTCLDRIRFITTGQSYNFPKEYFTDEFSTARLVSCCHGIIKSGTKNENHLNLCNSVVTHNKMPKMSFKVRLNARSNFRTMDTHQIGIPALSFLKNFSQKSSIPLNEIFKIGFLGPKHTSKDYSCTLTLNGKSLQTGKIPTYSNDGFFKDLRANLPPKSLPVFDELFQKHFIQRGINLADQKSETSAARDFIVKVILKANQDVKHPCHEKISVMPKVGNCQATCTAI